MGGSLHAEGRVRRVLSLPPILLQEQAKDCLAQWLASLPPAPEPVRLDGRALVKFDSSALATLLALRRAVLARGQVLELTQLPPRLIELSKLYGVDELLPI